MAHAHAKESFNANADAVWGAVSEFGSIKDWHPAVESLDLEDGGKLRRLQLVGGGEIVERLEKHDAHSKTYTYTIVSSPLPVSDYHATLKVTAAPDGKRCTMTYDGKFKAEGVADADAEKVVRGIYQAGLDTLKKRFG